MSKKLRLGDVMIGREELQERVQELGEQISRDYRGETIMAVGILKGAVIFMSDLVRALNVECSLEFMTVSSYGGGTQSSGEVRIKKDLDRSIEGENVLIIEDIIDSGHSMRYLKETLSKRGAKSIRICTLLDKPSRRVVEIEPDYSGFTVDDVFTVGYGMDYDKKYRNLPCISYLEEVEDEGEEDGEDDC